MLSRPKTDYLYAGEQYDCGLMQYYLRARYYDPAIGRFNRIDPFPGDPQAPQSLHKYAYVHNCPVNASDPSGWFSLGGALGAIGLCAAIGAITGGFLTRSWQGAVYGALAGASLAGVAIMAYLMGSATGLAFKGWRDAIEAITKTAGLGLLAGLIAVLAKSVLHELSAKDAPAQYMTVFLRAFSTVCMMSFGTGLITYGLQHKGTFELAVARWLEPERAELVLGLSVGFVMELTLAIGTGKIFTEPKQVLHRALISAGTTYLTKRFGIAAAAAKDESEAIITALTGFIVARIVEIIQQVS